MRQASRTLPLFAAAALVGGCMVERPIPSPREGDYAPIEEVTRERDRPVSSPTDVEEPPAPDVGYDYGASTLVLQNPTLVGAVGDVTGLRTENVSRIDGWGDAYWADVSTVGDGDNGAAMTILTFEGGLDHPDLGPGARLTFRLGEPATSEVMVYTIGCSGPAEDMWEFDEPASETTVEVEEHPDDPAVLVYSYEARFADGYYGDTPGEPSVVRGSFERVVE